MGGSHSYPSISTAQTELTLSQSNHTKIPHRISRKNRLAVVDLSGNNMKELPAALTKLVELNLSRNNISEFPKKMAESLTCYQNLRILDLSENDLIKLPSSLTKLKNIKKLILCNNKLKEVPVFIENTEFDVDLSQNILEQVPVFPPQTQSITLDYNLIEALESQIDALVELSMNMNRLSYINASLMFRNLKKMKLAQNRLQSIPDLTHMTPSLEELDASLNLLTEFPTFPPTITSITLTGNRIKKVPATIKSLVNLTSLEINDNELEEIPELPPQLESLSARGNKIQHVEPCEAPSLSELCLMQNALTEPPCYGNNKLKEFFIMRNLINRIPVESLFRGVVMINATENNITEIPESLFSLPELRYLNLARNRIQKVPAEITNSRLVCLNVSENPIIEMPEEFPRTMASLYCSYCGIRKLPESIGDLRYLETLVCCGNGLTEWPLTSTRILKKLLISRNKLTSLCDCLPESLIILDASCNQIKEVPDKFSIPALLDLDLSHNQIQKLPDLSECSRLTSFKISNNPLDDVFDIHNFPFLDCIDMSFTNLELRSIEKNRIREVIVSDASSFTSSQYKLIPVNDTWIGYAEMRGQRPYMEDAIVVRPGISNGCDLYCVFDGHDGSWTATYSAYKVVELFANAVFSEEFVKSAVTGMVESLRNENTPDGSTMVLSFVSRDEIIFANLGDSRALLIKESGEVKFSTTDHKPDNRGEIERILSIGGKVVNSRTDGKIAMSRSLGDFSILGIGCEPDIQKITLEDDDRWLVVGCDGLFDLLSNREVGAISTAAESARMLAYDLRNIAYHRLCQDNISAIVIDLKNRVYPTV